MGEEPLFELVLQHGWGYDSGCYAGWKEAFRDLTGVDACVRLLDRGYFGGRGSVSSSTEVVERREWNRIHNLAQAGINPMHRDSVAYPGSSCSFGSSDPVATKPLRVVVAHSFGLFLLPVEYLSCDLLVLLSSFVRFHPGEPRAERLSRKVVKRMRRRLESAPDEVVAEFHGRCLAGKGGAGDSGGVGALVAQSDPVHVVRDNLLAEDLRRLDEAVFETERLRSAARALVIHGSQDEIVGIEKSLELAEVIPGAVSHVLPDQPHALPLTARQQCIELIASVVAPAASESLK